MQPSSVTFGVLVVQPKIIGYYNVASFHDLGDSPFFENIKTLRSAKVSPLARLCPRGHSLPYARFQLICASEECLKSRSDTGSAARPAPCAMRRSRHAEKCPFVPFCVLNRGFNFRTLRIHQVARPN